MQCKNAIIESTSINFDDRRGLSCFINLDYGGYGQGFGGYILYLPKGFSNHAIESIAGHFIYRSMEIAGADRWDAMGGKSIRVKIGENGQIKAIGHIIKDDWFCPSFDFADIK